MIPSGLAEFIEPYALPASINSTSVRIDHTFGPKLIVFFRFGDTPSFVSSRVLSSLSTTHVNALSYTLGATSQLSSKISNEFRLGYSSNDGKLDVNLDSFGGAVPVNAAAEVGSSSYKDPFTLFYLYFIGIGTSYIDEETSGSGVRNWNIVNTTSILHGHHQMKFGLDFNRLKSLNNDYSPLVEALYYTPQAVENNQASYLSADQNANSTPITYSVAAFAQDEWRATSRLSLSFGVRWEIDPAPHGEHGDDAYTLLGSIGDPSTLTLAPRGTPLWKTYWYNFAPRLGTAWHVHNQRGRETVVRAGAGVYFDTYNEVDTLGFTALGFNAFQSYAAGSLPLTPAQLAFSPTVTPPYTSGIVYAFPANLQVPYTLQWNTSVEQSLGSDQTLTISYIGANGRRLITEQQGYITAQNPEFGDVVFFPNGITSNYQALQTKFQRTISHGIQALASYTWSHAIDFGSTYAAYAATRGNADFDVRHNLQAGISWDLPLATTNRIATSLFGHWGVDARFEARTGFPITLGGNELTDPSTGALYESGVNLVPGKPLYLYGSQYPGGRALNGGPNVLASNAAFTLPSGTNEGNAPRNFVRGFGENQINFAARRVFPIKGAASLQFRAEAFNILNHPNFGLIDSTLTDAQFGLATQTLNQSLATLASQYQQGGPRSMQFALKLTF